MLGATDRRLRAVVAQVPTISGYEQGLWRIPPDAVAALEAAFADEERAQAHGETPRYQAIVAADPAVPASYRAQDAIDFYLQPVPDGAWENTVTVRSARGARMYEPGVWVRRVSPTPLLMVVALDDTITVTDLTLAAYERALEPKRLQLVLGGHFDAYLTSFDEASGAAREWFRDPSAEGEPSNASSHVRNRRAGRHRDAGQPAAEPHRRADGRRARRCDGRDHAQRRARRPAASRRPRLQLRRRHHRLAERRSGRDVRAVRALHVRLQPVRAASRAGDRRRAGAVLRRRLRAGVARRCHLRGGIRALRASRADDRDRHAARRDLSRRRARRTRSCHGMGADLGACRRIGDGAGGRRQPGRGRRVAARRDVRLRAPGATRAHAAHKALLRTWAVGGVAAADDAMFDIAMPLFQTDDVKTGLAAAVDALKAGKPRPVLAFQGN